MTAPATISQHPLSEKIYLTYKTRMLSEARLLKDASFFNGIISWYSFWLIFFGLSQLVGFYISPNANLIFTASSIGIFAISLAIGGRKYTERAEQFRHCYLQLKELYESSIGEKAKLQRYADILKTFENQTDDDFDEMVFDAKMRGQNLYNSNGPIALPKFAMSKVILKKLFRYSFKMILIAAPAILFISLPSLEHSGHVQLTQHAGTNGSQTVK